MSSDAVMLDSPAQTPTPKGHPPPPPPPPSNSSNLPADIAMIMDDNNASGASSAAATTSSSWENKKYRDELNLVRSRLQHQNFDIARFRDPLHKPLVTGPPGLAPDVQDRMRKLFQERVSR